MSSFPIDEYFESEIRGSVLGPADLSKDDVFARAARGLRDVLRRLDALPRTDPFWKDTNERATIHKLRRYCAVVTARDPGDVEAWWCHVGLDLWFGANTFGSAGFKGLHALGLLDPSWPVKAAMDLYRSTGFDASELLGRLAVDLGIEAEILAVLMELGRTQPHVMSRFKRALRSLG